MPVGIAWNAGAVRARLLGQRRLGRERCAELAVEGSLRAVLKQLNDGPYGHDVEPDMTLASAQWAVAATPLWHLRILGGWLPPAGGDLVRVFVGWWEVLNVENLLAKLAGLPAFPPYDLGSLGTAWSRIRTADSVEDVRQRLAASAWRDPGSDEPAAIVAALRLSWARRLDDEIDEMSRLIRGWAALVLARDLFAGGRTQGGGEVARVSIFGRRWRDAKDLADFSERLPRDAAWVFGDVDRPEELWRAEVRWWRALYADGLERLRHPASGTEAVAGAFAVLLADAHGVQGALQMASRGGGEREAVDELL
jgi:hypothetical protein